MTRRADELAAEFLMRPLENPPRFLGSPPVQDGPDHVTPLRFAAGVLVLVLVAFVCFWGL
jgi:hypothetical protein